MLMLGLSCVTLAVVVACRDVTHPIAPVATGPLPAPAVPLAATSALGAYTIPVPPTNYCCSSPWYMYWNNHGKVPWTSTGITIPNNTSFVVNVSGIITATRNPHWDPNDPTCSMCGEYGPAGDWGGDHYQSRTLGVKLRLDRVDGSQMYLAYGPMGRFDATVRTDTIFTNWGGTIWVAREGMHPTGCWPVGGGQECDGKYLMSGTQTVEVLRVASTMRLVPNKTRVLAGTPVTFTPLNQSNQVVGDITWWHWEAPSPVGGACAPNDGQPCTFTVNQTGRMAVWANLDGRHQFTYSDYVTVVQPNLVIGASKTKVVKGEVVTYTASRDPGDVPMVITSWKFRPTDPLLPERTPPCAANEATCADTTRTTGTMWVFGTVNGVADSAGVHVNALDCVVTADGDATAKSDDDYLNTEAVREGLRLIWDLSNPTGPMSQRRERAGYVYRNPTTGEIFFLRYDAPSNPCFIDLPALANVVEPPPRDWIVASAHTHPYRPQLDTIPKELCGLNEDLVAPRGPSRLDERASLLDLLPDYIIDADNVYRTDGLPASRREWPRQGPGCNLISPTPPLNRQPKRTPVL
jgi:hypothetical protein